MGVSIEELVAAGLDPETAASWQPRLQTSGEPAARWRRWSRELLTPDHPLALHRALHAACFAGWDAARGPAPTWVPDDEEAAASNVARAVDAPPAEALARLVRQSTAEPESFWLAMLDRLGVVHDRAPSAVLAGGPTDPTYFPSMRLNIARSCFEGREPEAVAVIAAAPGGALRRWTVGELRERARAVARALRGAGIETGDAVAIDMPMTAESVAIYLGIVWAGAAAVSIADSFAPEEIATRLRIADAKAIFTQDVIARGDKRIPLYERVVAAAAPMAIVLPCSGTLQVELRGGDRSWSAFLAGGDAVEAFEPVVCDAAATTNVLFSSGTTGDPKAIPWTHVTPIKAATDGWGHHDIRVGDVVAWPTNLGWMMGPWLIYASLLNGASIALFEGSPLGRPFGVFVRDAGVTMLGVVPALVKTWMKTGCMEGLDWSAVRALSSTGEASTPREMHWLMARAGYKPVIEYCGGTEIGGGYITGSVVQPQVASAFSTPALGCDFAIIDDDGQPASIGELALRPPMIGSSTRLLNRDHHDVYFAGMPPAPDGRALRRHGDQIEHLGGGYYRAHGRVDDTMNLGGIKTSSASIERVCNRTEGVRETAAIAVAPAEGGASRLVIYAVLEEGVNLAATGLGPALQSAIKRDLNPLFKVHEVVIIDRLPRTASNKVMRRVLRQRYGEG